MARCISKLTGAQIISLNNLQEVDGWECLPAAYHSPVEGGVHWQPKGKFSVELMRIFSEASKEN